MNYYNEFDKKTAAWLQELINEKQIPDGKIDTRSIVEVKPNDLHGFTQCHFFAGIGGWSLALKLAGWPDSQPVWTGSCPCQPFSTAGKQRGTDDERHLWPEFYRLIKAIRPVTVFGEQVEGAVKHGWLDGVFADVEREGYATGATVLGAHSVGAPHIRQRLYWVADSSSHRCERSGKGRTIEEGRGDIGRMADVQEFGRGEGHSVDGGDSKGVRPAGNENAIGFSCDGKVVGLADAESQRGCRGREIQVRADKKFRGSSEVGFWSDFYLLPMRDGKTRRVESGSFPLAHGVSGRVGLLRGYGNAIVPQVAAEFINAYLDI